MCPYFFVASLPQTINEKNYWGSEKLNECVAATEHALNTVIMNTSTDGVSCKKNGTIHCVLITLGVKLYIRGKNRHLSLPDTNKNIKHLRYLLIGG